MSTMLPVLTVLDDLVAYLVQRRQVLDPEELDLALGRVGRGGGPVLLDFLVTESLVTDADLASVIGEVWSMAEYPDATLGHRRWLHLFDRAGYTVDGKSSPRPDIAVPLFRGSVADRRADWSWTDSVDVAAAYARDGIGGRPTGTLWFAVVDPGRLLARNTGRDEREYVVKTDGLDITELRP